ncbi:MAG: exopolyphosphatase [Eggerthellaceae bacterium]|jgi:exopolyphosphatase/guanosine-5'-triphosphate,3'-diphosphate pyrophosphatase|nr:exopolyphosphatase [Eggerthellaceae bacterium]
MPNYGVIDLGSNSVRLCVYEVKNDEKTSYSNKDFRSLLNHKVMAGLSAYVDDEVFSKTGIAHAIKILRGHSRRLKYFECKRIDVFATAVLRNCSNSEQAIAKIEDATNFSITLLSEVDEAHLGFVGASSDAELDFGTLIDIGGGSTELTAIDNGQDFAHVSLNQGSLSSFAQHVKGILPLKSEQEAITTAFTKKLRKLPTYDAYRNETFFGIGGSVRAAAKLYAELFPEEGRPETLTKKQISFLLNEYRKEPDRFVHFALKAVPDRVHTLIPGCLIVFNLMDEFGAKYLNICRNGIREGYLIERILLNEGLPQRLLD